LIYSESVSNFKVEKSENVDNAFYIFERFFWHETSKKRKKLRFLADRTNGRAYATVLRLSVVCDVMYCG